MRIGIAIESSSWGGLESHTVDLVRVAEAHGHEMVVVCSDQQSAELMAPRMSPATQCVVAGRFGATSVRQLAAALRELRLECCIYQKGTLHAGSFGFDVAARLACGVRYVAIQHCPPPALPPPSRKRLLGVPSPNLWRHRMIARGRLRGMLPRYTVCVSRAMAVALRDDYGFSNDRLIVLENGADVARFRPDPDARARVRAELGLDADTTVFGSVCRLVWDKGLDVAVHGLRQVIDSGRRDVRLLVAGEGPERRSLESLVTALGLENHVRLLGFRADVPGFLAALDFLILPSRMEGLPITVLEALAVGCPVIATDVGGTAEVLSTEDVGWLVPPDEPQALARAILTALSLSRDRMGQMKAAARSHAERSFNAAARYDAIVDLATG